MGKANTFFEFSALDLIGIFHLSANRSTLSAV